MLIRHWGASASGLGPNGDILALATMFDAIMMRENCYPGVPRITHHCRVMWRSSLREVFLWHPPAGFFSRVSQIPCHLSHLNTISLNKYKIDPTRPFSSWASHIPKSLLISGLGTAACKGSVSSPDHQILFWCFRSFTIRDESGDHQGKLVFAHFVTDCLCEGAISFFVAQNSSSKYILW